MAVCEFESFEHVRQFDAIRCRLALERAGCFGVLDDPVFECAAVRALAEPGDCLVVQEVDHEPARARPMDAAHAAIDWKIESVAIPTEALQGQVRSIIPHEVDVAAIVIRCANVRTDHQFAICRLSGVCLAGALDNSSPRPGIVRHRDDNPRRDKCAGRGNGRKLIEEAQLPRQRSRRSTPFPRRRGR